MFLDLFRRLLSTPIGIIAAGVLFGAVSPPVDGDMHWALAVVPFLSIPLLIPFFKISEETSKKKRFFLLLLWGASANIGRFWWLVNVHIPGKWILIVFAMVLLAVFLGLWYAAAGMAVSSLRRKFPKFWVIVFPSLWILLDYVKCSGELSFPWMLQGYVFSSILPAVQIASITGVWGITWFALVLSALAYERFSQKTPSILYEKIFASAAVVLTVFGLVRLSKPTEFRDFRAALIQQNIDQINWDKETSLDSAQAVTGRLIRSVKDSAVDWIVLSESGVYAYLDHNIKRKLEVMCWVQGAGVPIAMGTLDYTEKVLPDTGYSVYNTSFLLRPDSVNFEKYHKMKLVPVSEGMPYGWKFPILSRIKIPGGGFERGFDSVIWKIGSVNAAPTICYESIYPGFNRDRVRKGADCIVNMTNDSWFGLSSGPYQHAAMARMRAIECGVPILRCTASGVSFVSDSYGRIVEKTKLGIRTVLVADLPKRAPETLYLKFGDWFVALCALIAAVSLAVKRRDKTPA